MKKFFLSLLVLSLSMSVYAESGDTTSTSGSSGSSVTVTAVPPVESLSIKEVRPKDQKTIEVEFSDAVVSSSARMLVNKQSDNSTVSVDSIATPNASSSNTVLVIKLADSLENSTSYKITVLAASTEAGANIKEWVDAVREFSTPSAFAGQEPVVLNAPDNQNAVISTTSTAATVTADATAVTVNVNDAAKQEEKVTEKTTSLPATGLNPLLLVIIAVPLALLFFRRKKSA